MIPALRPPFWLLLLLILPMPALLAARPPVQSEDQNRAALVIRAGDEQVDTFCVPFSEPEISGYELLQRAGREVVISDAGLGITVCRVDNVGCPAGDCFCQCKGDPCVYWSYWHQQQGEWQYAVVGASTYMVQPGAVEGWSWGPGSVTEAIAPPPLSFDDVCAADETIANPTAAAVVEAVPSPAEPVPSLAEPTATVPPATTSTGGAAPPATSDTSYWFYGLFALIVLGLGGFLWWLQRREEST